MELRPLEGGRVLRVWHLAGEALEARELLLAPLTRRLGDRGIVVVGEELERRRLAVLLAHEEERDLRREEEARGGDAARLGRQPVALCAVADLVVVLRVDDETPVVLVCARKVGDGAEAGVVAVVLI